MCRAISELNFRTLVIMTAAIDKKSLNQLVHVIIAACQGDAVIGGDAVGTPSMP